MLNNGFKIAKPLFKYFDNFTVTTWSKVYMLYEFPVVALNVTISLQKES